MVSVKFVTHAVMISFRRISEVLCNQMNSMEGIYCSVVPLNSSFIPKTQVTFLHEALYVLEAFGINRDRDGTIICITVSDTDKLSEEGAKRLNETCDHVVTPSWWSKYGLVNGGVDVPITIIPNPVTTPKLTHERRVGFYISMHQEQFHRKGTDLALQLIPRIPYPVLVKHYFPFIPINFPNPVEQIGEVSDMSQFYSKISHLVLLSRAGAFELPAWEAYCSGAIPIVPTHPLFTDLPAVRIKSTYSNVLLPPQLSKYHVGGGYEADLNDALAKVKYAWENYDELVKKLVEKRDRLCASLTVENIAAQYLTLTKQTTSLALSTPQRVKYLSSDSLRTL